ncbi:MAG: hypothetical protein IJ558_07600 [Treponema sp.]|nr:hypothetical protein [Treponema sp.]
MDNANKIAPNLTHKEVALFLGDDLHIQNDETITTYNLVDEYAKTRKHYKPFVWVLLAICFFIVGAGTFTTIGLLSNSNKRIAINIDSFDDLNLRSLLSSAGRTQNLYENALRNKVTLEESLENELAQAEQKRKNALFTLQSVAKVATSDSLAHRRSQIEQNYTASVTQIHETYDTQILDVEEQIKKYKAQIEKYDSNRLSQAQESESSLDSTKQLHDLEMRTQSDRYEKKLKDLRLQLIAQQIQAADDQRKAVEEVRSIYQAKIDLLDPKAREQDNEQDKIILDTGIQNQTETSAIWKSVESLDFDESRYTARFASPSQNFVGSLKTAKKELAELETVASRFKPIPMENSIKDYVPALVHQSYQIANDLAEGGVKMQEEINGLKDDIAALNTKISERNEVLESFTALNPCDAIIITTKNAPKFPAYVAQASRAHVSQNVGVPAQILNGNKAVSDATLSFDGTDYIVTQIIPPQEPGKKNVEPYQVKVGDRIRIVLQQKK